MALRGAGQTSACKACAGLCGSDVSVPDEWPVWLALPVVLVEICACQICVACVALMLVACEASAGFCGWCCLLCSGVSMCGFCWPVLACVAFVLV